MGSPKRDGFTRSLMKSGTFINHRQRVSANSVEVSFSKMNGWEKRTVNLQAGDKVRFRFQSQLASGSIAVELVAPDGTVPIRWGDTQSAMSDFVARASGRYTVKTTAVQASGAYKVEMIRDE